MFSYVRNYFQSNCIFLHPPITTNESSCFSSSSPVIGIIYFCVCHSNKCRVVSHLFNKSTLKGLISIFLLPLFYYHKSLRYLIYNLWTHFRQTFYKHVSLTYFGLWYSTLGHHHVQILFLFYQAPNCPQRVTPSPWMDALLPLLGLWFSTQNCILLFGFPLLQT